MMLTKDQLENLKAYIGNGIYNGDIEYSKDRLNAGEVFAYARSMVMNHLKKAKELNGNQIYGVGPAAAQSKAPKALAGIDMSLLTEDLKAFVDTLV